MLLKKDILVSSSAKASQMPRYRYALSAARAGLQIAANWINAGPRKENCLSHERTILERAARRLPATGLQPCTEIRRRRTCFIHMRKQKNKTSFRRMPCLSWRALSPAAIWQT